MANGKHVNTLRLRLTDEINHWLFDKANAREVSVSTVLRDILLEDMAREKNNEK